MRPLSVRLVDNQNLYFAYGSNLSFAQMAARCPGSKYIGTARLRQYSIQINERGFANVLPSADPNSYVDGLLYRLTPPDETALDRNEGVPTAYQKSLLAIEYWPASPELIGREVANILRNRDALGLSLSPSSSPLFVANAERDMLGRGRPARAVVYLSGTHVMPGRPWDEYIKRIETGLAEAQQLGISQAYVWRHWKPLLAVGRGVRRASTAAAAATSRPSATARAAGSGARGGRKSTSTRSSPPSTARTVGPGSRTTRDSRLSEARSPYRPITRPTRRSGTSRTVDER